jgi:hypothetical protein
MPLRLGDRNESVRTWRRIMNARFGGLYTRLHGPLPTDTDQFGPRAVVWQKEYESRTQQPQDGEVSDNDLRALGITPPPVVEPVCVMFSINGAGSTWDMGYPFDIGETLDKSKVWHQPIGYNTNPIPMKIGVQDGINEFIRQLGMPRGARGLNCTVLPWTYVFYSMGALVGMAVVDRVLHGDLGRFKSTYLGGATFGNPRRQEGHTFPGCMNSDGMGISQPNDHDMPESHWDMAASAVMPGSGGDDLYTKIGIPSENPATQANMRAVWDIVNELNPLTLAEAVLMLLAHPTFEGGYAAAVAALHALDFFVVKQTGPHVRYQFTLPIANDPRDCWELARGHVADLVARVPRPALLLAA